jgi:hypothetical protein
MKLKLAILFFLFLAYSLQSQVLKQNIYLAKYDNYYSTFHSRITDSANRSVMKFGYYMFAGAGLLSRVFSTSLAFKSCFLSATIAGRNSLNLFDYTSSYSTSYSAILIGTGMRFKYGLVMASAGLARSDFRVDKFIISGPSRRFLSTRSEYGVLTMPFEIKYSLSLRNWLGLGVFYSYNKVSIDVSDSYLIFCLVAGLWNRPRFQFLQSSEHQWRREDNYQKSFRNYYLPFYRRIKYPDLMTLSKNGFYFTYKLQNWSYFGDMKMQSSKAWSINFMHKSHILSFKQTFNNAEYKGGINNQTINENTTKSVQSICNEVLLGESFRFEHMLISVSSGLGINKLKIVEKIRTHYYYSNTTVNTINTTADGDFHCIPIEFSVFMLSHNVIGNGLTFGMNIVKPLNIKNYYITYSIVFGKWNRIKDYASRENITSFLDRDSIRLRLRLRNGPFNKRSEYGNQNYSRFANYFSYARGVSSIDTFKNFHINTLSYNLTDRSSVYTFNISWTKKFYYLDNRHLDFSNFNLSFLIGESVRFPYSVFTVSGGLGYSNIRISDEVYYPDPNGSFYSIVIKHRYANAFYFSVPIQLRCFLLQKKFLGAGLIAGVNLVSPYRLSTVYAGLGFTVGNWNKLNSNTRFDPDIVSDFSRSFSNYHSPWGLKVKYPALMNIADSGVFVEYSALFSMYQYGIPGNGFQIDLGILRDSLIYYLSIRKGDGIKYFESNKGMAFNEAGLSAMIGESIRSSHGLISLSAGLGCQVLSVNHIINYDNRLDYTVTKNVTSRLYPALELEAKALGLARNAVGFGLTSGVSIIYPLKFTTFYSGVNLIIGKWNRPKEKKPGRKFYLSSPPGFRTQKSH